MARPGLVRNKSLCFIFTARFHSKKANNPEVIRLAGLLERTPAAVARKLGNFGAFDDRLAAEGISGLDHGSKQDEAIWEEFSNNWERLVSESKKLLKKFGADYETPHKDEIIAINIPSGPTERKALMMRRVYQDFFRRSVLSSHNNRCCVSGVAISQLLVAGHIIPWTDSKEHRLNPENGLSLCVLFDKAFDCGLMAIDQQFRVIYSKRIKDEGDEFVKTSLLSYAGKKITLPKRFAPRQEFLEWHRKNRFVA